MTKCPQCGYSEIQQNKPFVNAMHKYVNPVTGKVDGVYNNDADEIVIQPKGATKQTTLVKLSVWEAREKAKKAQQVVSAPAAPKGPVVTAPKVVTGTPAETPAIQTPS